MTKVSLDINILSTHLKLVNVEKAWKMCFMLIDWRHFLLHELWKYLKNTNEKGGDNPWAVFVFSCVKRYCEMIDSEGFRARGVGGPFRTLTFGGLGFSGFGGGASTLTGVSVFSGIAFFGEIVSGAFFTGTGGFSVTKHNFLRFIFWKIRHSLFSLLESAVAAW